MAPVGGVVVEADPLLVRDRGGQDRQVVGVDDRAVAGQDDRRRRAERTDPVAQPGREHLENLGERPDGRVLDAVDGVAGCDPEPDRDGDGLLVVEQLRRHGPACRQAVPAAGTHGRVHPGSPAHGAVRRLADGTETARVPNDDGTIGQAEVRIGDSVVMMFDGRPGWPETPAFLRLNVQDGDAVYQQALDAGASRVTELTELFWGDRVGRVRDPLGNVWWVQQRVTELEPEEIEQRASQPRFIEAMRYLQSSEIVQPAHDLHRTGFKQPRLCHWASGPRQQSTR